MAKPSGRRRKSRMLVPRVAIFLLLLIGFSKSFPLSTKEHYASRSYWHLMGLQAVLEEFAREHGKFPDPTSTIPWGKQLDIEGFNFGMSGFAETDGIPLDHKDRPVQYRPPEDLSDLAATQPPSFVVYSVGDNGIDEAGQGDDIAPYQPIRTGYYWKRHWNIAIPLTPTLAVLAAILGWCWWRIEQYRGLLKFLALTISGGSLVLLGWLWCDGWHLKSLWMSKPWYFGHALGLALIAFAVIDPVLQWTVFRFISPRRPLEGHCPSCNYDLTDLPSSACPECGTTASPPSPDRPPSARPRSG